MQENLKDICTYLKALIIKNTPKDFTAVNQFRYGLTDDEIRAGITAFRQFLYNLYDKIAKEETKIKIEEFAAILYMLGIQGELQTEPKRELIVHSTDLLIKTKRKSQPNQIIKKMPAKRIAEVFEFLTGIGFYFEDLNYENPVKLAETGTFYMSNENDSNIIIGLKLLAKAQEHMPTEWDRLQNGFMRCDFNPLASETPIDHDMQMINFADTQPPEIKEWLLNLNKLLLSNNCYTDAAIWDYASITYASHKPNKMVCKIDMLLNGCKITPNTTKIKSLDDIAPKLSNEFLAALKEDGCACGRGCKKGPYRISCNGEEFLSCNNPPHKPGGFNIPLANAEDRKIIKKWIETELGV